MLNEKRERRGGSDGCGERHVRTFIWEFFLSMHAMPTELHTAQYCTVQRCSAMCRADTCPCLHPCSCSVLCEWGIGHHSFSPVLSCSITHWLDLGWLLLLDSVQFSSIVCCTIPSYRIVQSYSTWRDGILNLVHVMTCSSSYHNAVKGWDEMGWGWNIDECCVVSWSSWMKYWMDGWMDG